MTKRQRARLKGRELAVWSATYAAHWTQAFKLNRNQHGWDAALEYDFAEMACAATDAAVQQLREWEATEV